MHIRGCQISMQGPQLCAGPCHFCKLDVPSSRLAFLDLKLHVLQHGLRTSNEGINQRNVKIWADVADEICFSQPYRKIWEWELIFGRAVKVISSLGVHSP